MLTSNHSLLASVRPLTWSSSQVDLGSRSLVLLMYIRYHQHQDTPQRNSLPSTGERLVILLTTSARWDTRWDTVTARWTEGPCRLHVSIFHLCRPQVSVFLWVSTVCRQLVKAVCRWERETWRCIALVNRTFVTGCVREECIVFPFHLSWYGDF